MNVTYAETYISDSQVLLHDPKIEDKFVLIGSQSTGKKKKMLNAKKIKILKSIGSCQLVKRNHFKM